MSLKPTMTTIEFQLFSGLGIIRIADVVGAHAVRPWLAAPNRTRRYWVKPFAI
jgi:hypothetical protein